jgi:hypothetical protein
LVLRLSTAPTLRLLVSQSMFCLSRPEVDAITGQAKEESEDTITRRALAAWLAEQDRINVESEKYSRSQIQH